jgi:hypothetical protein
VCVCVGFVLCVFVGISVICVLLFTVFLYCFIYVCVFFYAFVLFCKLCIFSVVYVFLLLCMFCSVYSVFIVPNGTLWLP